MVEYLRRSRLAQCRNLIHAGVLALALAAAMTGATTHVAHAATDDAKAQLAAGDKATKAKDWAAAVTAYSASKAQNPTLEAMEGYANALYEKGDHGAAYEAYEDLIRAHVGKLTKEKRATAEKQIGRASCRERVCSTV